MTEKFELVSPFKPKGSQPAAIASLVEASMGDVQKLAALGEAARETIPVGWEDVMKKVRARYLDLIENCRTEEMKKRHAIIRASFLRDYMERFNR